MTDQWHHWQWPRGNGPLWIDRHNWKHYITFPQSNISTKTFSSNLDLNWNLQEDLIIRTEFYQISWIHIGKTRVWFGSFPTHRISLFTLINESRISVNTWKSNNKNLQKSTGNYICRWNNRRKGRCKNEIQKTEQ